MTETTTSKVEKWSYPLKIGTAEATDPQQYYQALAKAKDGYYPLGANGLWHGGVHFDEATGLVGDLTEVRCIADGEVVAYRIDEAYPKSDYGSTQAVYSTGFVLVKHRLEVPAPPAPRAVPGAPPPPAAAPMPSLTFFSLYMHLLDWNTYKLSPALNRPAFWNGGTWQVKATADDKVLGLRVRQEPRGKPGYGNVLTVLPRGTSVVTGEEERGWLKVVSVLPADSSLPPGTGWVFKREMTAGSTLNTYTIGSAAKDEMDPPIKGLAVRAAASQSSATTAILPTGTQVKIGSDGTKGKYQKLLEIINGEPSSALAATNGVLGYVWEGLLETKSEPAEKDAVYVLEQPLPIKAGALVGHVGKYQSHSDSNPQNLLHLEVFSCDDVKAYVEQSRARISGLPIAAKTLVKIPIDSPLITHVDGMNATNPPKVSDPYKKVGYEYIIPTSVLEALPADKKLKVPVVMGSTTTHTLWWHLEGLLSDADGNEISGWFAEPDIMLSRHSPFEWEGFSFIEETSSNIDNLAAFLHAQENLNDEERSAYSPNIGSANDSPAKQKLYKILDRNGDKKLSVSEIKEALAKPWFSQPISQMIVSYESEWQFKKEKWDSLDKLMGHETAEPNKEWESEKARIERLSWWDKMLGKHGIHGGLNVFHINCIGLVGSFTAGRDRITIEMLRVSNPTGAEENHRNILPYLNKYAAAYKLEKPRAIAHFLSQVAHESSLRVVEEGLRYSATQMKKIYGCKTQNRVNGYNAASDSCNFGTLREKLWTQTSFYAMNAENLASYVYANRMGNGSEESKEGYMYRGRGMLQVTGKSEYRKFTTVHNQKNPTDIQDFVANPDLLVSSIEYGVESAFVFWFTKVGRGGVKLSEVAETGSVAEVTELVNGGQNGYADRDTRFQSLQSLMRF